MLQLKSTTFLGSHPVSPPSSNNHPALTAACRQIQRKHGAIPEWFLTSSGRVFHGEHAKLSFVRASLYANFLSVLSPIVI